MHRSYKFQMRPTARQSAALTEMLSDHCTLYNAALQERRGAYGHTSKTSVGCYDQIRQLKDIRANDPAHDRWSSDSQRQTLLRLDRAFAAFFRRVKAGQTPGYPRFRSVHRFDSVTFTDGKAACWTPAPRVVKRCWAFAHLQGVGWVKVAQHRQIPQGARVKQMTVKREGSRRRPRWFVLVSCDDVPEEPLPATGCAMGLDLATGENGLAYGVSVNRESGTITEEHFENARPYRRAMGRLAAAQQEAVKSKPKPGQRSSARHKRNLDRVRAIHGKVTRARRDHLHKTARAIVNRHGVIVVEDLKVRNMVRRSKPRPDPENPGAYLPNNAAAKSGLNRSIHDSGWSMFISFIRDKAECAGREVIAVNPAFTSQMCHACGARDPGARDGKRYRCPSCGWAGDADINAAHNILRAGLVLLDSSSEAA